MEENQELKALMEESQSLRDEASFYHEQLTKNANEAQHSHDVMLKAYKEADRIRKLADQSHKNFIKAQTVADERHKMFINTLKDFRDFEKVILGLNKMAKNGRKTKEKMEAKKKAEDIFDLFKKGEKLDTEDLLLLQRSSLL